MGTRNREGQALVKLMTRNGLAFVDSLFQKRENHKIAYRSRHHKTELDLVLIRNNSYGGSRTVKQSLENTSQPNISQWRSLFA